ncbi:MAG: hypothetical protein HUU46_16760 [Candidatus Hydrogenedentes bacterium]|nr:hypothetical protein [Candidatus Hydrogenedentota bacterium]
MLRKTVFALLVVAVAFNTWNPYAAAAEKKPESAKPAPKPKTGAINAGDLSAASAGVDVIQSLIDAWNSSGWGAEPKPAETPPPAETPATEEPTEGAKLTDEELEKVLKALEGMTDTLEELSKPLKGTQSVISEDDAFELTIPPNFYVANFDDGEFDIGLEKGKQTTLIAGSDHGPACIFVAWTFPIGEYIKIDQDAMLAIGKDTFVANFKIDDSPFTLTRVISTSPVSHNNFPGQEWRMELDAGGRFYYALLQVHLKAPRIYAIIYIGANESDLAGTEAYSYISSMKIK